MSVDLGRQYAQLRLLVSAAHFLRAVRPIARPLLDFHDRVWSGCRCTLTRNAKPLHEILGLRVYHKRLCSSFASARAISAWS